MSPRVTIVVAFIGPRTLGAAMKEISGSIWTDIQGPCGCPVAAARGRRSGRGCKVGWHRGWNAAAPARLDAVITTAAMSLADKSAWCREHGVYPAELEKWLSSATASLAEPEQARASPQATRKDRKRIKELERELHRKDVTVQPSHP
jgi:hypothetical protein